MVPVTVQVYETSDYEARKAVVGEFNAANRFRKRGIAIIPTKFGISFTTKFLNQVRCSTAQVVEHMCSQLGAASADADDAQTIHFAVYICTPLLGSSAQSMSLLVVTLNCRFICRLVHW